MDVTVLFFGVLRERVAKAKQAQVTLPEPATVGDLVDRLCGDYAGLQGLVSCISVAVNEEMARPEQRLTDGDTVALLPPIAGGAEPYARLTEQPLSVDEVVNAARDPRHGAVVTFTGWVREDGDLLAMHYEAYESMARHSLADVALRSQRCGPKVRVALAHRIGELRVGDLIVVIAAAAPTRADAYEAARTCLELLKHETPIWKKEIRPAGDVWVGVPAGQGAEPVATGRAGSAVQ
jgi:molybdopterin synthase catalytic subunit/molybdopterin converting factor small subunit